MFTIEITPEQLDCHFSSSLEMIDKALQQARQFMEERYTDFNEFEFRLVLREALNNAVLHGNKSKEWLPVHLSIQINPQTLKITITDQGTGFDWQERLNRQEAAPEQTSGRGLILIQSYGYDPTFNKSGNSLKLKKNTKTYPLNVSK